MVNTPGEGGKPRRNFLERVADAGNAAVDTVRQHARALAIGTALTAAAVAPFINNQTDTAVAAASATGGESGEGEPEVAHKNLENLQFATEPSGKEVPMPMDKKSLELVKKVEQFKRATGLPIDLIYTQGPGGKPVANLDLRRALNTAAISANRSPVLMAGFGTLDALRIILGVALIIVPAVFLGVTAHKFLDNSKKGERLDERETAAAADFEAENKEFRQAERALRDFEVANPSWVGDPALVTQHRALEQRRDTERQEADRKKTILDGIRNTEIPKYERGRNWRRAMVILSVLVGGGAGGVLDAGMGVFPTKDAAAEQEAARKQKEKEKIEEGRQESDEEGGNAGEKAVERIRKEGKDKPKPTPEEPKDPKAPSIVKPAPTEGDLDIIMRQIDEPSAANQAAAEAACKRVLKDPAIREAAQELCNSLKQ